jgi:hypothetical protein
LQNYTVESQGTGTHDRKVQTRSRSPRKWITGPERPTVMDHPRSMDPEARGLKRNDQDYQSETVRNIKAKRSGILNRNNQKYQGEKIRNIEPKRSEISRRKDQGY